MASDLRVVNQSFLKFGDSVQKAGASLHKQAVMADGLINSGFWCKDCIYLKEVYRFLMESILMQPFRIVEE
ncbi:hypothetical protein ACU80K_10950 [Bacillus mycoides]|uniref:hypothetical protein n=1 Tax=Bacillus mycoides TaxID=1405 RepID=UPI0002D87EEC